MAIRTVTRAIDPSTGAATNTVNGLTDTERISGVVLKKAIPQGVERRSVIDQVEITAAVRTLTLSTVPTHGIVPNSLRVLIDGHVVSNPGGYQIAGNVITPSGATHERTYIETHTGRAFQQQTGSPRNRPDQVFLIDQSLPSEVTTTTPSGSLVSITITNTGGIPGPSTRSQPIISVWTADLATTDGGGSGTLFFENATNVIATNIGGQSGYLITFDTGLNASAAVSDVFLPPNSNNQIATVYNAAATAVGEVVRAEYDVFLDGDLVEVRPSNVTATITVENDTTEVSHTAILLKNGPKGGFSQEFTSGVVSSGGSKTHTITVNDVVEAVLTSAP